MRWSTLALAVLFAGCGTRHQAEPAPDASGAGRGVVSIQVIDLINADQAVAGARVVISDPDGSTFAIVTTDERGLATAEVLPGGSVSVLPAPPLFPAVETVMDVEPGDHLVMGRTSHQLSAPVSPGSLTAEFASYPGSSEYALYTSCGYSSGYIAHSPASVTLGPGCSSTGALVIAQGSDGPLASVWSDPQPVSNGATISMPSTWTPAGQFTTNLAHVRAGLQDTYFRRSVGPAFAAGEAFQSDEYVPAPGDLAMTVPFLAGPAAQVEVVIEDPGRSQTYGAVLDPAATTFDVDLATDLLPWIGAIQLDPATGVLHENIVDLPPAAVVETEIHATQDWIVFAPTAQDLTLPALPPDVALPAGSHGTITLTLGTSDAVPGYDAVRAFPFQALDDCTGGPGAPGTHWRSSTGGGSF